MPYGGMGGGGMASPYMMMGQMGAYPPGAAAFGFPGGGGMPFSPQAGTQGTPFAQHGSQQQQQQHGPPQLHMPR
jgi:hypothetical protein